MATDIASGSSGGTSNPETPSSMISAGPPPVVATTGRPRAIASTTTRPNGSFREALTTTAQASNQG